MDNRKKLIEQFQKWLNTNPNKNIRAVECANIAIQYHKEQLRIGGVVGRSEQLPDANKRECNCSNAKDRLDCGFECYNK